MVTTLPLSKETMSSVLVFLSMQDLLEWRRVTSSNTSMWASESHVSRAIRRMAIDLHYARDQLKAVAQLAPGPRRDGSKPVANRDLNSSKWKRALNIGHKGAAGHFKGNTMASFIEAVRLGVDMIEFDVLTTVDRVVICHHDPLIEETGEWIENLTIAQTRERLKYNIPTFEEMLQEKALVSSAVQLYIDLKHTQVARPVLQVLCQAVERWGWTPDRLLVGSFRQMDLLQVNAFRQAIPELAGLRTACILDGNPISLGRDFEALGVAALSVGKDHVTPDLVADCQRRGVQVWVWTVNSVHFMERLLKMGVDGICTDYPERVNKANKKFRPGGEAASQTAVASTFRFPMAPDPSAAVDFRGIVTEPVTAKKSVAGAPPKKAECSIDSPALGGVFSGCSFDAGGEAKASEQRCLMAAVYGDFVGVRDFAARAVKEVKILTVLCTRATAVKASMDSGDRMNESAKEISALCNGATVEAERVLFPIVSSDETSRWLGSLVVTKEGRDFISAFERDLESAPQPFLPFEKAFVNNLLGMAHTPN